MASSSASATNIVLAFLVGFGSRAAACDEQIGHGRSNDVDARFERFSRFANDETAGRKPMQQLRDDVRAADRQYAEALAALKSGSDLEKAGKLKEAAASLRSGIEELGDLYSGPEVLDDTEMKKILADHNQKIGKLSEAVALYRGVLETRTALYAAHFAREGRRMDEGTIERW